MFQVISFLLKISFKYGSTKNVHLTLGQEFEIVENLKAHEDTSWVTVPEEDIKRNDKENLLDHCPSVEVVLKHKLLKENVKIEVPPDCHPDQLVEVLKKLTENALPVIIYAVSEDTLNDIVIFTVTLIGLNFNNWTVLGYTRN